jgi:predicted restriction endonuclease
MAGLQAHHVIPLRKGGKNDPITNGVCLCPAHHRIVEREAAAV